jgi:acetyl-CoA carboxylase biotin carboxylase subunit
MLPGGPGVRVGIMLYSGYVVPPYRDSLLAKIIAHAET